MVQTDANNTIAESLEDNNAAIAATPTDIAPAYTATLSIVPETLPTGTPIPITGTATLRAGGPAAYVLVNIHISNAGVERTISALTNSAGQFSTVFTPLPGEGGLLQFGASHPGADSATVQDEVRVYGLKAEPSPVELSIAESGSQTGSITIRNLSGLPVTGLAAAVTGLPVSAGIAFTPALAATTLTPTGTVALNYQLTSQAPHDRTTFTVSLSSTEGAALAVPVAVTVVGNAPKLVADPAQLAAGMLRGGQQMVNFTLRNDGPAATAPIRILLPSAAPWIKCATPLPIPSLAPGQSVPITIQLTPPADLPLGDYSGTMVATDGTNALTIPFNFRALSDQMGQLIVRTEDEYTYFATGNPPLAGATVTVTDALTRQIVATLTTGATGSADFGLLREGYYDIEATADRHSTYRGTHLLKPDTINEIAPFLSRQTVIYTWTVEPVESEDRYKITVDTTFETNVPIPVVIIEPTYIDLSLLPFSDNQALVNFTITNHGLIAANNVHLSFPEGTGFIYRPAVEDIGTLPAKSSLIVPVKISRDIDVVSNPPARTVEALLEAIASHLDMISIEGNTPAKPQEHLFSPAAIPCLVSHTLSSGDWTVNALVCGKMLPIGTFSAVIWDTHPTLFCVDPTPYRLATDASFSPNDLGKKLMEKCEYHWVQVVVGQEITPNRNPFYPYPLIDPPNGGWWHHTPPSGDSLPYYDGEKGLWMRDTPSIVFPETGPETAKYALNTRFQTYLVLSGQGIEEMYGPKRFVVLFGFEWSHGFDKIAQTKKFSGPTPVYDLGAIQSGLDASTGGFPGWKALGASNPVDCCATFVVTQAKCTWDYVCGLKLIQLLLGITLDPNCQRCQRSVPPTPVSGNGNGNTSGGYSGRIPIALATPCTVPIVAAASLQTDTGNSFGSLPLKANGSDQGVCARVKLRIEQDAVIARDAFRAILEVTNNGASRLENVRVDIKTQTQAGDPAGSLFGVQLEGVSGLSAVDGTGILAAGGVGTARWKLTPTVDAAPTAPAQFRVGGTLTYTVDGLAVTIPFYDVPITVLPSPRLTLKYFHQRDVFSDDPHTPQVEPSIPYSLAVMVQNNGFGTAKNMTITSAQPKIIENEKGLLIDFQIIATQVSGQPLQPTLTANFGDVGPGQITIGEWLFTSSLQGHFIDYKATFEHVDGLGNPRLSLIDSVEIHEMIHQVRALGALDDGKPDFLVNDIVDPRDLPDTIYLSNGTIAPVAVVEQGQPSGPVSPTQLSITLSATLPAGWAYLRIVDPANPNVDPAHPHEKQYELTKVVRSDGLELPLDVDAWVTDRTFIGDGKRPIDENILHLLDYNSTGSYTLTYVPTLAPDVTPPVSHVLPLAAQSAIEFPVNWTGNDDRRVAFYDVYASTDGGAWQLWLQRSQDRGALFRGDLGHTYAFYSRATDGAGNLEAAPATADATTTVSLNNIPPTLAAIPDQQITEGDTLTVDLTANDPDGRSDLLSYAFTSTVPPGVTIDSRTGRIRWVTGESDGGRTVPVTVRVTDTGVPAQSATRSFTITVLEDNKPPVLADVPPQRVAVGGTLTVQLQAADADLQVQTLTYRFTSTPPTGMTLDTATGLLSWQPSASQANATVSVAVAVTDSGTPPKEAAITFAVTVEPLLLDRPPQFYSIAVPLWLIGTTHTLAVNAFDPDGDGVTLALDKTGLPGGLSFASTPGTGSGVVTWNTTGVSPGVYALPIHASAGPATVVSSPQVKLVNNNGYWRWAVGNLNNLPDAAMSDPTSDPDHDGTSNIFEWALMRNALVKDWTPMNFTLQSYEGGWRSAELNLHRRRGSNEFVTLIPQSSNDLSSWSDVPSPDWESFLDPFGNRDNNPDSEEVLFRIWLSPAEAVERRFFRLKSSTRAVLP